MIPGKTKCRRSWSEQRIETPIIYPIWVRGPEFLRQGPEKWLVEINKAIYKKIEVIVLARKYVFNDFIQVELFSKWERTLRAISHVLRYISLLQKNCGATKESRIVILNPKCITDAIREMPRLSEWDLKRAEIICLRKYNWKRSLKIYICRMQKSLPVKEESKI